MNTKKIAYLVGIIAGLIFIGTAISGWLATDTATTTANAIISIL